jgi:hypothetical protein
MSEPMIVRKPKTQVDFDEQRAKGWLDFHIEDFCHRCGNPNPTWRIDSAVWNRIMRLDDGRDRWDGIVCPSCFDELAVAFRAIGGIVYELKVDSSSAGGRALLRASSGAKPPESGDVWQAQYWQHHSLDSEEFSSLKEAATYLRYGQDYGYHNPEAIVTPNGERIEGKALDKLLADAY